MSSTSARMEATTALWCGVRMVCGKRGMVSKMEDGDESGGGRKEKKEGRDSKGEKEDEGKQGGTFYVGREEGKVDCFSRSKGRHIHVHILPLTLTASL